MINLVEFCSAGFFLYICSVTFIIMGRTKRIEKPEHKKAKHGNLGEVVDKRRLDREEERDIQDMLDPIYYENYCGACLHFNTPECPFNGKITELTRWRTDIDCNKFYD